MLRMARGHGACAPGRLAHQHRAETTAVAVPAEARFTATLCLSNRSAADHDHRAAYHLCVAIRRFDGIRWYSRRYPVIGAPGASRARISRGSGA